MFVKIQFNVEVQSFSFKLMFQSLDICPKIKSQRFNKLNQNYTVMPTQKALKSFHFFFCGFSHSDSPQSRLARFYLKKGLTLPFKFGMWVYIQDFYIKLEFQPRPPDSVHDAHQSGGPRPVIWGRACIFQQLMDQLASKI